MMGPAARTARPWVGVVVASACVSLAAIAGITATPEPQEPLDPPDEVTLDAAFQAGEMKARDELLEQIAMAYRQGTRDEMDRAAAQLAAAGCK